MEGYIIPAKEAKEITAATKDRTRELKKVMTEINIGIGERAKQGYSSYQPQIPISFTKEIQEILQKLGYEITYSISNNEEIVCIYWE